MNYLFISIHHVKEHEASMFVFIFFVQLYKMVLFIKRNSRKYASTVRVVISAVKSGKNVVLSKADEIHRLEANINQFVSLSQLFHKLPMRFCALFGSSVFYHRPSPLEVEGIFALQNGRFSNRSCHNAFPFF